MSAHESEIPLSNRHIMAVATAAAVLLALATGTANAETDADGAATAASVRSSRPVCGVAPAGFAAYQARVVTTGWALRPMASAGPEGLSPAQLNTAYGLTGLTGTAAGTIAIVNAHASPNAAADLDVYRQQFGLGTVNLTQMRQNGGPIVDGSGDPYWGQEEMLSLEMASAICPACPLLYVAADTATWDNFATAVNTAAAHGAKVISNTYLGAEFADEAKYAAAYDHPGVAITVGSGPYAAAAMPAVLATVTAVGGTTLNLNADGTRASETVYSETGSGCSKFIRKPAWQTVSPCGDQRAVVDVAAVGDPNTGVSMYDSYGSTDGKSWYVFGGTTASASIVAGLYGLAGSTAAVPAANAYTGSSGLFDVTSGSNGTSNCNGNGAVVCTGGPGWDGPSGNGTPNGSLAPFGGQPAG